MGTKKEEGSNSWPRSVSSFSSMNAPPTGVVRTKPRVWLGWSDISKERETQTSFQACGYAKGMEEAAASRQQHRYPEESDRACDRRSGGVQLGRHQGEAPFGDT